MLRGGGDLRGGLRVLLSRGPRQLRDPREEVVVLALVDMALDPYVAARTLDDGAGFHADAVGEVREGLDLPLDAESCEEGLQLELVLDTLLHGGG